MADGPGDQRAEGALVATWLKRAHRVKVSLRAVADPVVKTTVTALPESRARVEVEVAAKEVAGAVDGAARSLGRNLKLPGFRKGKIPAAVVIQRLGRDAVVDEAVHERIGRWYAQAIGESAIAAIGDPDISVGDLPADGEPLRFSFEIGVRPPATLGAWQGLEVAKREAAVAEEDLERELDQARERLARLEPVARPAARGDFVVIDYSGTIDGEPVEGAQGRAQLVELGSGRLVPGFEEGLLGSSAGEERKVAVTFPEDYRETALAGAPVSFDVAVSEVREKILPELSDEFATDAAGFDTLEEMRDELRGRLLEVDERAVEREFRGAVLDAAVAASTVSVPAALIDARAKETWERTLHSLEHRGVSKEAFLSLAGKSEEEMLIEARPDAEQALRREAVLAAIIAQEDINPSDDELLAALVDGMTSEQRPTSPRDEEKLLDRLRKAGRLAELREDVAGDQALERLIAAAKPIAPGLAAAREKLWTPGT
jgi:trigger factor